jgi:tetrahydromethanopterin S-methyltransferase subunit G
MAESKVNELTEAISAASLSDDNVYHCTTASGELVDIKQSTIRKVPYLDVLFDTSKFAAPAKESNGRWMLPSELDDLRLLNPILAYVEKHRPLYLLTRLSCNADVAEVLQLYEFLNIDALAVADLDDIHKRLTDIADTIDSYGYTEVDNRAGRSKARDAAAELCCGLVLGTFDTSQHKTRQKIYSRVEYVLGHSRTFHRRIRHHMMATARSKCSWFTATQVRKLEGWMRRQERNDAVSSDEDSAADTSVTESDLGASSMMKTTAVTTKAVS